MIEAIGVGTVFDILAHTLVLLPISYIIIMASLEDSFRDAFSFNRMVTRIVRKEKTQL